MSEHTAIPVLKFKIGVWANSWFAWRDETPYFCFEGASADEVARKASDALDLHSSQPATPS